MKKNVLLITASTDPLWAALEKAGVAKGLEVVRVSALREALFRLENEIFSVAVLEDDANGVRQRELAEGLRLRPFGQVTPFVVLGSAEETGEKALITSVLDQYFPVSTEADVLADFLLETQSLREQSPKCGHLGPVAFPEVLYQAARLKMDGALTVEQGDTRCVVYLENGRIVFSSINREENRFGDFLISRKIITEDQLLAAVEIMQKRKKRLGKILVEEGYLKPQVLQTLLQSQIRHIIFTVFDWPGGDFHLLFTERCEPDDAIANVDIASLILEGVHVKFDEPRLNAEFDPFDARISLAVPLDEIERRHNLGKNEVDFLKLIGKGRPIQELLTLNSYSRLESLKLLYSFRVLGLLVCERGAHAPGGTLPRGSEKARALGQLMRRKTEAQVVEAKKQQPEERTGKVDFQPRAKKPKPGGLGYLVGGLAMGLSLIVLLIVFSVLDTHPNREALIEERGGTFVPDLAVERSAVRILKPERPAVPQNSALPDAPKENSLGSAPAVSPTSHRDEPRFKTLVQLGASRRKEGKPADALVAYQRALGIDPENASVNFEVADLLSQLDRPEDALVALDRVKKADPSDPRPYLASGKIHLVQNRTEQAKEAFRAYLAMVPATAETQPRIDEVKRILKNLETHR
ncbi:MAG: DUF4388 domain-containing protein [Pseudomonadota bacterium]